MNNIAMFLLLMIPSVSLASNKYYTDPTHPGRHYDCAKGALVAYENNEVIIMCGAVHLRKERRIIKGTLEHWTIVNPKGVLVKGPAHDHCTDVEHNHPVLSQAEVDAIALGQFQTPFYDSSEKRMVRIKGFAIGADLITTVAGLSIGNCSEAGPLKRVPYLGLAIGVGDVFLTRHDAKKSPRFFTSSKDKLAWAPAITHSAAAVNNLVKCVF